VRFLLHDHHAQRVAVLGSWDGWRTPGLGAVQVEAGVWQAEAPAPAPGRYVYKFLIDGAHWHDDVDNPRKAPDGFGGLNCVLTIPEEQP
jgi:1,4-alpha-glucan branching enzyme